MGLDRNGAKFLLYADSVGTDFTRTAMIGRQGLHLKKKEIKKHLSEYGYQYDNSTIETMYEGYDGYAEGLLKYLGAYDIHSYDNSNYEDATHIHNMNLPISESSKEQYTLVIDGGSLEHVFNFPTAIKNCMEMLQAGGHFISLTPANNMLGHGFYQFSPELFYRIFSRDNGFSVVNMILFEARKNNKWYSVMDPNKIGKRVTLKNTKQTYLMVLAKKIKCCEIFSNAPQQSDYVKIWNSADLSGDSQKAMVHKGNSFLSKVIKNWHRTPFHVSGPRDNPEFFVPFDASKYKK